MDLGIGVSGAKIDAEADFDVCSAVVPPKHYQIMVQTNEKLISNTKKSKLFPNCFVHVLGVAKRRKMLEF